MEKRSFLTKFAQKPQMTKMTIFCQNAWTFWTFLKLDFFCSKGILFYPEYQKTIFSGLIWPKTTKEKNAHIWPKPMDLPLWKFTISWTLLKVDLFCLKKILLYPEYQKTIFPGWICPKTTNEKNGHLWPKTMD